MAWLIRKPNSAVAAKYDFPNAVRWTEVTDALGSKPCGVMENSS